MLGAAINEAVLAASIIKRWPAALLALCSILASFDAHRALASDKAHDEEGSGPASPVRRPAKFQHRKALSTQEISANDLPLLPTDQAEEALAKLLLRSPTVNIRAGGAALGALGNAATSALLCCSTVLRTLDVSQCYLDRDQPGGGAAIANALRRSRTVTSINLATNELTSASGEVLLQAIRDHPSLHNVSVANNLLPAALRRRMHDAVEASDNLKTSVALHEFPIEAQFDEFASRWESERLQFADGLRELDLSTTGLVLEQLEEDALKIQLLAESLYIAPYRDITKQWLAKIVTTREVLERWLKVQRDRAKLVRVFSSAELSQQLQDSKRFHRIDQRWTKLLQSAHETALVVQVCYGDERTAVTLKDLEAEFDACLRGIAEYLKVKRTAFPRLYFISASDLLDIVSLGKDPAAAAMHIHKFTDATAKIGWQPSADPDWPPHIAVSASSTAAGAPPLQSQRLAAAAPDGEASNEFTFVEPYACSGAVEEYLSGLVAHMAESSRLLLRRCVADWHHSPQGCLLGTSNTPPHLSQHCLIALSLAWALDVDDALRRRASGEAAVMRQNLDSHQLMLQQIVTMLHSKLPQVKRRIVNTCVTIYARALKIEARLLADDGLTVDSFAWRSQLRYEWDAEADDVCLALCDFRQRYSHEYIGNTGRLVITELTDRAYLVATQALSMAMGVAPFGPAGTGKTESMKDLAKSCGIWAVVANCTDLMDEAIFRDMLAGMAQTGCWLLMDEFNRIKPDVVATTIDLLSYIFSALRARLESFIFDGETTSLSPTCCLAITYNPGYLGRTELPAALWRSMLPCSMAAPDFVPIAEVNLFAEGFQSASKLGLGRKFVSLFTYCRDVLSKQANYDWGLRAMHSVFQRAGSALRECPDKDEEVLLAQTLYASKVSTLVARDVPSFLSLLSACFPSVSKEQLSTTTASANIKSPLVRAMQSALAADGRTLQPEAKFVGLCLELSEMLSVRHSVCVLGAAGLGKSEVLRTLQRAQNATLEEKTMVRVLNAKAGDLKWLYGHFRRSDHAWVDGTLSSYYRELANANGSCAPRWLILDGDIDSNWAENLNTVMDDNKMLTLANNDRISLPPTMRLVFETHSFNNVSPAFSSRCPALHFDQKVVSWRAALATQITWLPTEAQRTAIASLGEKLLAPILECWGMVGLGPLAQTSAVCTIFRGLVEAFELGAFGGSSDDEDGNKGAHTTPALLLPMFALAVIWGIGGSLGAQAFEVEAAAKTKTVEEEADDLMLAGAETYGRGTPASTRKQQADGTQAKASAATSTSVEALRARFDHFWSTKCAVLVEPPFPENGSCFDYCVNIAAMEPALAVAADGPEVAAAGLAAQWMPWKNIVPNYVPDASAPFESVMVPTAETTCISHLSDALVGLGAPVLLLGGTGRCKSAILRSLQLSGRPIPSLMPLADSSGGPVTESTAIEPTTAADEGTGPSAWAHSPIVIDSTTSSSDLLMALLAEPCTSRNKGVVGPPPGKKLICILEDMNISPADVYGTQEVLSMLHHLVEHAKVHRQAGTVLKFADVQFVAAIDAHRGSPIPSRLLRHFACLTVTAPTVDVLLSIYLQLVGSRMRSFTPAVLDFLPDLVRAAAELHVSITYALAPTPSSVHYMWSPRTLTSVFGSILALATPSACPSPLGFARLWRHETTRVYADRLTCASDVHAFVKLLDEHSSAFLGKAVDQAALRASAGPFVTFAESNHARPSYVQLDDASQLSRLVKSKLEAYQTSRSHSLAFSLGDLVIFAQAAEIVCRLTRILAIGHGVLVSVGSAGRRSLTHLAAFISDASVWQPSPWDANAPNVLDDFYAKLREHLIRLVVSNRVSVLLFTAEVLETPQALRLVASLVQHGLPPKLFAEQDRDFVTNALRDAGVAEASFALFAERARTLPRVVCCMSPAGSALRESSKVFPALVHRSTVLWFATWPEDALCSVATTKLRESLGDDGLMEPSPATTGNGGGGEPAACARHLAAVLLSIRDLDADAAVCPIHITPRSYMALLEQVAHLHGTERCRLTRRCEQLQVALASMQRIVPAVDEKGVELQGESSVLAAQPANRRWKMLADASADRRMETREKLSTAATLHSSLSVARARWTAELQDLQAEEATLLGHVLLAASFVTFCGPLAAAVRHRLINEVWRPDLRRRGFAVSPGFVPTDLLCSAALRARWRSSGLPADATSEENAVIVTVNVSARFPLMIDPQGQATSWLARYERDEGLVRLSGGSRSKMSRSSLEMLQRAIEEGLPVLLESIGENAPMELEALLARKFESNAHGTVVSLGGRSVDVLCESTQLQSQVQRQSGRSYSTLPTSSTASSTAASKPLFRLYLASTAAAPLFSPSLQGVTTLVDFSVTDRGLEDQLLQQILNKEQPELLQSQSALLKQQAKDAAKLRSVEERVFALLAEADGNMLANDELVSALHSTELLLKEHPKQMQRTEAMLDKQSRSFEIFRPVARRGAAVHLVASKLSTFASHYQFPYAAFQSVFNAIIDNTGAPPGPTLSEGSIAAQRARAERLQSSVTEHAFFYVAAGLSEHHRLVFGSQLAILIAQGEAGGPSLEEARMLLEGVASTAGGEPRQNPVSGWLSDVAWEATCALASLPALVQLPASLERDSASWQAWLQEGGAPEHLPADAVGPLSSFQRLLVIFVLSPRHLPSAIRSWAERVLGFDLIRPPELTKSSLERMPVNMPMLFVLHPEQANPTSALIELGKQGFGVSEANSKLLRLLLGQGLEQQVERSLQLMIHRGGWLVLEHIERLAPWLPTLAEQLTNLLAVAHRSFRLFMTTSAGEIAAVPKRLLELVYKQTSDPPTAFKSALLFTYKEVNALPQARDVAESHAPEFRMVVLALCVLHSIVMQRKRFGSLGWNVHVPFTSYTLHHAITSARRLFEANASAADASVVAPPWRELRAVVATTHYGAPITDLLDQSVLNELTDAYLQEHELPSGERTWPLLPSLRVAPQGHPEHVLAAIESQLSADMPNAPACGLHPNAAIGEQSASARMLLDGFRALNAQATVLATHDRAARAQLTQRCQHVLRQLPAKIELPVEHAEGAMGSPLTVVWLDEIERLNRTLATIHTSVHELLASLSDSGAEASADTATAAVASGGGGSKSSPRQGLISAEAQEAKLREELLAGLTTNTVPSAWTKVLFAARAHPDCASSRPLSAWLLHLQRSHAQLARFALECACPVVTWLPGISNPIAFISAVKQALAVRAGSSLDQIPIAFEVMGSIGHGGATPAATTVEEPIVADPRGVYVSGLQLSGARWDVSTGKLTDAIPGELYSTLPVALLWCDAAGSSAVGSQRETSTYHLCPVFATSARGPSAASIFEGRLRTTEPARKWVLAGVALCLELVDAT